MNAAHLISATTLALAAGSAFAYDDVQHFPTPSSDTRAEVRAERAEPITGVRQIGEATVFVERSEQAVRSRAEVRAEARQTVRDEEFNPLYTGA